jgi:hypothetical protein
MKVSFPALLARGALLGALCTMAGCNGGQQASKKAEGTGTAVATTAASPSLPFRFVNITKAAGITFEHNNGAFGLKLMPETMGSGCAFIDYDNDGYQDLFLVNGRDWTDAEVEEYRRGKWSQDEHTIFKRHHPAGTPPTRSIPARKPNGRTTSTLFRNNGDGTFTDVTSGSGLDLEMYGMGAAVGDYDNDGKVDLYVTGLGRNYLFRNVGAGNNSSQPRFTEVAQAAAVRDSGWSMGAAWLDYDKDGNLDLFVCHYVQWTPGLDRFGTMNGRDKSYTAPFFYNGELSRLFRNAGNGRFVDVSDKAGIRTGGTGARPAEQQLKGKSLGVAVCDYDNDDWPDIVVANDSQPNYVYRNNKNGTFSEIGHSINVARNYLGNTRGGMGIDTADIDHSNRDSIAIGNFDDEMIGLYYNQGKEKGYFMDIGPATEVGRASEKFSVFGCMFLDADNDGWPDLLAASGHIDEQIDGIRGTYYALRPLLFLNEGKGKYKEVGLQAGEVMQQRIVGRGLAKADIDLDGDSDVVFTTSGGPAILLRNDGGNMNNAIRLVLHGASMGTSSANNTNRSGIGAQVRVILGKRDGLRRWVRSGSSYLSQSELPLTIGLGSKTVAPLLSIRWPSGKNTQLRNVAANHIIVVDENKGVVSRQPLKSR